VNARTKRMAPPELNATITMLRAYTALFLLRVARWLLRTTPRSVPKDVEHVFNMSRQSLAEHRANAARRASRQ
jgi:hypothetical protein